MLPPKKEVALALLERSNVDIYLDPRAEGVVVPPQFTKDPRLILKIGLNMPVPIPDLRLDDQSMSCTLSFSRQKFFCVVPWASVFAMVGEDGRGMVWPDDVPQELATRVVDDGGERPKREREGAPSSAGARARAAKSKLAEDVPSPRGAPRDTAAAKKSKKKKDEGRPALVAVPQAAPAAAGAAPPAPASSPATPATPTGPTAVPSPAAAPTPLTPVGGSGSAPPRVPAAASNRPKRELPPYLRVVK